MHKSIVVMLCALACGPGAAPVLAKDTGLIFVSNEKTSNIIVIDPAVSYAWAETDLSMLWSSPRPPASDRFFELYQELNPSPPGWIDRMPILHLRELLSTVAHFGSEWPGAVQQVRDRLAPFY